MATSTTGPATMGTHGAAYGTGFTTRPVIMGTYGVVAAGHYLAAEAGFRMLERGGNAVDAGVAAGFALNVLEPQSNGIGGEVPILVYSAAQGRPFAVNGQGWAPKGATIGWFKKEGIEVIPGDGFLPATVPGAFGSWATALMCFGRLSLKEVLTPAIDLTESGFPVYPGLVGSIAGLAEKFVEWWPTSAAVYLPDGEPPKAGTLFRNRDWAETFKRVVDVEIRERHRGREVAIQAAIDYFYKGEPAKRMVAFTRDHAFVDASGKAHYGLFTIEDFAAYQTKVEDPLRVTYRGYEVYKCNTWCQGPVFLQQLTLLEGYDLAAMEHNSPEYIHTVIEASKLAFADRETYYGDPDFVDVPLDRLLSKAYAAERRTLMDPDRASLELRPGDTPPSVIKRREGDPNAYVGDTTHLDVVDREGNMMSATPSGGWIPSSPVVEGLGFPLGTRGQMFSLDPDHPNALMPWKRPRATLTPSLVTVEGKPFMVFGTPGGDCQDQWTLQFFLNFVDFEMDLQEAIDAPTFHSEHFPSSFYPRAAYPGKMVVEGRIPEEVRAALQAKGHTVEVTGNWANGKVLAVKLDRENGVIAGAASPRHMLAYVVGR